MGAIDIKITSYIYLLLLIVPILVINSFIQLKMNKRIVYAIIRMVVQLFAVGFFLQYLFEFNQPFVNVVYITFMIMVAAYTAIKSCNLPLKRFIVPITIAFILPTFLVLFYFNKTIVELDNIYEAQYLIPISGMLLGNSLSGIIISLNDLYNGLKKNEKTYLMSLSFSVNRYEALKPYYKQALLSSLKPVTASLESIGLVALPGMMTGQILGGSIPIIAIKYQIAIMLAILVSRYFCVLLALLLSSRKAFNDYDILTL